MNEILNGSSMLIGKIIVESFDSATGDLIERLERDNMVFDNVVTSSFYIRELAQMLKISGQMLYNVSEDFDNGMARVFNTIVLTNETAEPDLLEEKVLNTDIVGVATTSLYTGPVSDVVGNMNKSESGFDASERKARFVYDFPTNIANGTFQSVSFYATKNGGLASSYTSLASLAPVGTVLIPDCNSRIANVKPNTVDFGYTTNSSYRSYPIVPLVHETSGETIVGQYEVAGKGGLFRAYKNGDLIKLNRPKDETGAELDDWLSIYKMICYGGYIYYTRNLRIWYRVLEGSDFSENGELVYDFSLIFADLCSFSSTSVTDFAFITPTRLAVLTTETEIDPVLGIEAEKIVYILNITSPTSATIERRVVWDKPNEIVSSEYEYSNFKQEFTSKSKIVYDLSKNFLELYLTSGRVGTRELYVAKLNLNAGYEGDELAGIDGSATGLSSQTSTNGHVPYTLSKHGESDIYVWLINPYAAFKSTCTTDGGDYDSRTFTGLLVKHIGSKVTRALLPSPVTKTNTETMKVTYEVQFPEF